MQKHSDAFVQGVISLGAQDVHVPPGHILMAHGFLGAVLGVGCFL